MGGASPPPLAAHGCAVLGKAVYIFGGLSSAGPGAQDVLYCLNTGTVCTYMVYLDVYSIIICMRDVWSTAICCREMVCGHETIGLWLSKFYFSGKPLYQVLFLSAFYIMGVYLIL